MVCEPNLAIPVISPNPNLFRGVTKLVKNQQQIKLCVSLLDVDRICNHIFYLLGTANQDTAYNLHMHTFSIMMTSSLLFVIMTVT